MPRINDINDFVILAEDTIYYDLIYTEVIGGATGCIANINNVTVNVAPQSTIPIVINSFSGGTGCFLGGYQPDKLTKSFISVWDTTKTSAGSSTATQVKLPLNSSGTYNFIVDWGDGSKNKITTWNQAQTTHTYTTGGVYQITIIGILNGFGFVNTGDRLKLLSVFRWGTSFILGNVNGQFFGCGNLDLSEVEDVLNLAGTTSFGSFFRDCARLSVVNRMNEWDTSKITNFASAFQQTPNFNTYIGDWDTSNVTDMNRMFDATAGIGLILGKFNQNIGKWNISKVVSLRTMFQTQPSFNQDISTKVVTRLDGTSYIAWDTANVNDMSFMFGANGYVGNFNQNIGNWNTSKVTTIASMFVAQAYFNQDISTKVVMVGDSTYIAWDTSNVTTMNGIFNIGPVSGNGNFNQNIGNWNTSKVTILSGTFFGQPKFNQDLSTKVVTVSGSSYIAWDTSNVTTLSFTFGCFNAGGVFNQNIGNWNTSKVTTMGNMFQYQPQFNQDISTKVVTVSGSSYIAWNTSNVTILSNMFLNGGVSGNGIFNQNIGNWNTSKVTTIAVILSAQPQFNQDISTKVVTVSGSSYIAWDMSNVTSMAFAFSTSALDGVFNQNISNWNTSKVTTMSNMFLGQPYFNQDIGTKQVTVSATTYSAWTVSGVTNMSTMFGGYDPNTTGRLAGLFNNSGSTSINNWDTRRLTGATDMFNYQIAFNQPINNWNISGVTTFNTTGSSVTSGFMFGKSFNDYSTTNYDALLISWSSRSVKPNIFINFGNIKHTSAAVDAKAVLTSAPNNWTIIDGGLA